MMRRRTGGFPLLARTQQGWFTACDAVLKRKPTQFCQGSICRPQQGALEVNHCPQPMGFGRNFPQDYMTSDKKHC